MIKLFVVRHGKTDWNCILEARDLSKKIDISRYNEIII